MKRFLLIFVLLAAAGSLARTQNEIPPFPDRNPFLLTSPGALRFGMYGFDNPALLTYAHQFDLLYAWTDKYRIPARAYPVPLGLPLMSEGDRRLWGLFAAIPNVGFGMLRDQFGSRRVTDYRLSAAAGSRSISAGLGYGWSRGSTEFFSRSSVVSGGLLIRGAAVFSLGVFGSKSTKTHAWEGVMDLGVRPLKSEMLTVFGDFSVQNNRSFMEGKWSYGAVVEPLPGIRLTGRYFDTRSFTLGLQISFGNAGAQSQMHFDESGELSYRSYGVRIGAYDRNVFRSTTQKRTAYVPLDLNGPLGYQRFVLFDKTNTLSHLLDVISAAEGDPAVAGLAINTSGMSANREMLWELRQQLKAFKSSGKHVIIFVDRPNIDVYHFASVADRIVMDPAGMLLLEGYVMGRTFFKGTLDKLGIGVDEWRFFKYKSAAEVLSRDRMSDADREQRQQLVDDFYRLAKTDIVEARHMTPVQFDRLVDSATIFLASDALAEGLVDTLGRWDAVKDGMTRLEGTEMGFLSSAALERFQLPPDNRWGEPPKIAVIYALGACDMDSGIRARSLVKDVDAAVNDRSIRAIVLRVDSPGGDAMASDYIAEAMKKARGKKPIIVSQGAVAGSGGYWLSMYADTIVAAPNTITGSIGVIGNWLYDQGLKEKLGLSTDFVKAGARADLGFGFSLPLIGGLPDRKLTPEERSRIEKSIRTLYEEFVAKVASGREATTAEIESVAQGRVWSGTDGLRHGLVDLLGSLTTAISVAKERAGIPVHQPVKVIEFPVKGLFDFGSLMPRLIGAAQPAGESTVLEMFQFYMRHNGQPMPIMSIDDLEFTWERSW